MGKSGIACDVKRVKWAGKHGVDLDLVFLLLLPFLLEGTRGRLPMPSLSERGDSP